MTTTLREMVYGERDALDALIAMDEGELTATAEQLWAELEGAIDEKIERWALWTKRQDALADAIKVESDRLAARRTAIKNAIERSRAELQRQMEAAGKDKVKGVLCTVSLQANPAKVVGELDETALADIYADDTRLVRFVPATFALDRKAVLDAHKAGEQIPDGLTVEQTTSIRIR